MLTISNQITASPTESPVAFDPKKLKKVALRHLSWWQVMTEARVEHKHRGISDPDQAWLLGELIAYLDNERAGAVGFEDMGQNWVGVRDGARQKTLRLSGADVREVARRWEEFVQYLALGLCQDLGKDVAPMWPKKLDAAGRSVAAVKLLVDEGKLSAAIRVPGAIAAIELDADLRTRLFTTAVEVIAPREGRAKTRIGWLTRQLRDAPDDLRIEVRYPNARETSTTSLKEAREKPDRLLLASDSKREPRSFRLSMARTGAKRGRGPGSFVYESKAQTLDFYRLALQGLRAWSAAAPKLPSPKDVGADASPEPPDFSAVDGRGYGEATEPADRP